MMFLFIKITIYREKYMKIIFEKVAILCKI